MLAVYLLWFIKSYHCYILFHLSCSQYFASQHAGHFLIIPSLVCKKCLGCSLRCGRPGITVGRARTDPLCEHKQGCFLSRWEGLSQASCFISDCHSPNAPLQQGWSQKIFLYCNVCGTYGAGSYRRSPVSLEADASPFRAHPVSINFSFKGH